ncbi:RHS repeat-associated core domain-containing protein [Streptomyces sp. NPDC008317]|uniref:RHS repeat-associated core domain-containing protein n=1 Tax=Streptomyces sp. NPDC008317 TaxID=3364827 RepID=UPI0036EDA30B
MARPTDWDVLDLDRDPVPGDPFEVKELARKLGDFADDVASALRSVRGLSGDTVVQEWAGLSGDAYRQQFGDLPGELDKLERSYRLASGALDDYWPKLETAQGDADRALAQGRTARQELDTAKSQLTNADAWVKRAQDKSKSYQEDPKPDVPPPSAEEVRAAARNATDAQSAHTTASTAVHSAQAKLDAAKQLAADAAQLRDDAASTAQHALHEASDAGIRNKHWWEKAVDWVADHWDDIIAVCKVIVAVLGIVVLIIGGPLAWLVLAAAVLVLADTVMKYLQGQASLWDVLFAALDCIPMFKGLTTAGGLLKMARELPALLKSGRALENIANSVRKGAASLGETSRMLKKLFTCGDPIDMATGEMVMSATDAELPGVLPLVIERTHRTNFRGGRWFGPTWASTLDQRLVLDDQGVRFTTADGMTLDYPIPGPGLPVMPVTGPRWPLTWDGTPGGTMTVAQPETGQALHFRPLPGRSPADLPLHTLTDRNDNRVTVTYDPAGAPARMTHDAGYQIGVTTADGRVTALHLISADHRPALTRYAYTGGHLTAVTNSSGLPLTFTYDPEGRITGWQDRNTTWYGYTYDGQGRCVRTTGTDDILAYTYRYDPHTHTTHAVNSLGHTTTYEFNDRYQLLRETDPLHHTTHRTWDPHDNLLTHTDPLGHTTTYTYDTHGNPTHITHPNGTVATVEYEGVRLPVAVTQPDGGRWRYTYDERGNQRTVTDPTGATTVFERDGRGALASVTDALGVEQQRIENDAAGIPVALIDAVGAVVRLDRDPFGRIRAVTSPAGEVTELAWTVEGLLSRRVLPDGSTDQWAYDGEGNTVEHRGPDGRVTRYEISGMDSATGRTGTDGAGYTYAYDTERQLTSVTNPLGLTWTYERDPVGRVIRETDFDGRTIGYVHDAAGRLVERVNGAGERTRYERDAMGQATEVRAGTSVSTYAFDAVGRTVRAVNEDSDLVLARDATGRVVAETGNGRTVAVEYDALGRRVGRVTPSGARSRWEYDRSNSPVVLHGAAGTVSFGYDRAGRETERRTGDRPFLTQEWDGAGRLVAQTVLGPEDPSGALAHRRAYGFGADGYLATIGEASAERRLTTDAAGRVVAVDGDGWSQRYTYDGAGNLTSGGPSESGGQAGGERTEDAGEYTGMLPRRLGRTRYTYDAQGRLAGRTRALLSGGSKRWTYTWDAEDRLTGVTTPDGSVWRYRYDALGRRIAKERLGPDGRVRERTDFTWYETELVEERTTAGDTVTTTTWDWTPDGDAPVAQTERSALRDAPDEEIDRRFYAIVTDLIGTPTELIGDDGRVHRQGRATVWGAPLAPPDEGAYCPLRFPGQYADPETGLHYNHYRYYDPESARYLSPDPLGLAPAPNNYAYVHNPTLWSDPLGLGPCISEIAYASTDLAKAAFEARFKNGVQFFPAGRNVAAARVEGLDEIVIGFSKGKKLHAEIDIINQLKAKGISMDKITHLYTERYPCSKICLPALKGGLSDLAKITYTVPYAEDHALAGAARDMLRGLINTEARNHGWTSLPF